MKDACEKVCISFAELYRNGIINLAYGGHIEYYFDNGCDYYDLIQGDGDMLIGCDGEEWVITKTTKEYMRMQSEDTGNILYLTPKEYEIAVFE